ncbi:MAG: class I mannose-6-phosphate isomerase [Sphingomonadales bacterium]|nr:class I mannose-6-phosphate isomerase [Sphingomonadales bacterium]
MVAKPWGRPVLPAPFANPGREPIGEIWFEPPPEMPGLLAKYLFTAEALSVQVHPSDADTLAAGLGRQGKEECWLVIAAEPGAQLGIGTVRELTPDALRAAAQDGSIAGLLEWFPVAAGDFFYIPAGTIHAIGAGVALVELQQTSEITYRLYDYGRPRALHLDEGVAVARAAPHAPAHRTTVPPGAARTLVEGPHFRVDKLVGAPDSAVAARYRGAVLALPLGEGVAMTPAGEDCSAGVALAPGTGFLVESLDIMRFEPGAECLIAQSC